MRLGKIFLHLTVAVTAIHSPAQCSQNKQRGFEQKFVSQDETDKFTELTITLSEFLETCNSTKIERLAMIRDHIRHTYLTQAFLDMFTLVQMKYLVLGGIEQFVPFIPCEGLYRNKLDAFIVIAATARNFKYMLKRLRNTKWQNSGGLFIVIDSSTVKSGCRNAESYLRYSWELNILQAVFFCLDVNGEILIYTYNPFTNRAPQPWQEVQSSENDARSPAWTLFKRQFIRDETVCTDLMFDKVSHLDGYKHEILAVDLPPTFSVKEDATKGLTYRGMDPKIHMTFSQHINATPSFTVLTGVDVGWVKSDGVGRQLLGNVSREEYDILGNTLYNFNKQQITSTYPHFYTGLAILTKSASLQTVHMKIVHFMNPKLIGGLTVIYIVTVMILGILNRYGITAAFLETTRLITNSSMTRRIDNTALRIYLFPVFLLFLISSAAFQCRLAAILTRPLVNPDVNSYEDLQSSGFLVYIAVDYMHLINDTLFSNLRIINGWNCSRYVINEENTACVAGRHELMTVIDNRADSDLHLSTQNILSVTSAYVVKPFWPLQQKFEAIISRLFRSGILDLWIKEDAAKFMQSYQMYQNVLNDRSFRILKVEDLKFAFVSLIIGLCCSICVFIIECMLSYYKRHRHRKNKSNSTFSFVE